MIFEGLQHLIVCAKLCDLIKPESSPVWLLSVRCILISFLFIYNHIMYLLNHFPVIQCISRILHPELDVPLLHSTSLYSLDPWVFTSLHFKLHCLYLGYFMNHGVADVCLNMEWTEMHWTLPYAPHWFWCLDWYACYWTNHFFFWSIYGWVFCTFPTNVLGDIVISVALQLGSLG